MKVLFINVDRLVAPVSLIQKEKGIISIYSISLFMTKSYSNLFSFNMEWLIKIN